MSIYVACRKKKRLQKQKGQPLKMLKTVRGSPSKPLTQLFFLAGKEVGLEMDTGSRDNFISIDIWHKIGRPKMSPTQNEYKCASNQSLLTLGVISVLTSLKKLEKSKPIKFIVTRYQLHVIGRESCRSLLLSLDQLL